MDIDLPTAKKILHENLKWVGFAFLVCTLLVFLTFSLGVCYRRSTIEESQEHADTIIQDIRNDEKARKEKEIRDKHAKVRDDMEAKYPGMKQISYEE